MTAEELATAIRDVRVVNFPSLVKGTGGPTQHQAGISTEVRENDRAYAKALIATMKANRREQDQEVQG